MGTQIRVDRISLCYS